MKTKNILSILLRLVLGLVLAGAIYFGTLLNYEEEVKKWDFIQETHEQSDEGQILKIKQINLFGYEKTLTQEISVEQVEAES